MFPASGGSSSRRQLCWPVPLFERPLQDINGQVDPRSLKFKKNIHGKPELEWNDNPCQSASRLQFNISHTSSLILCGVTVDSLIGVDLEEKQRKLKNDILAFARRYFTPHEVKFLSSISDPGVQHQYFVKLWTLKESYVKALGRGFSGLPFKMFTIQFGNAEKGDSCISGETNNEGEIIVKSLEHVNSVSSNWQFALLELAGSHYAAICMEKDEAVEGRVPTPMKLTVRKTIPYMRDEFISGPDAVVISGLT
ncbi:L-aminoadipate-semialdehyde dehydrogenase-phosphopantetheinyl transferase isoform X3 [Eucalyptus grandis]|uniref:L-aminoadipate-semialdehyde dehydrogenase-phosphopantetheinyl transferase isoform X3 n=1 Tax=Eucalyptus grandis TaxID=71139 RepID=UPI00192EEE8D|nr:L-aminoadipate-semialdehyde dehydrogenase-phosphopantetheinyl transferase isoform X3 [Eucalyptus grandis]XP_039157930.1 L-aminoadipate-semialdehyde dehydrogenase-phosphopantetheinyl transferase isoform X3 [Eucalyptus grandis]